MSLGCGCSRVAPRHFRRSPGTWPPHLVYRRPFSPPVLLTTDPPSRLAAFPLSTLTIFSRPSWPSSESFSAPPPRALLPSSHHIPSFFHTFPLLLHSFRHFPLPVASCLPTPACILVP